MLFRPETGDVIAVQERQEVERTLQRDCLRLVRECLQHLESEVVVEQLKPLVRELAVELNRHALENLPPLVPVIDESKACVIEWSVRGKRLGFAIEVNAEDSGWFFIGSRKSGRASMSGHLSLIDLPQILDKFLKMD